MIVYHATPRRNRRSIDRTGLDPARSKQGRKAVWLFSASRLEWAILHVANRHRCKVADVIVYTVEVDKKALRKHARGLFYHYALVPVSQLRGPVSYELAAIVR
jgi:hypothetical protein